MKNILILSIHRGELVILPQYTSSGLLIITPYFKNIKHKQTTSQMESTLSAPSLVRNTYQCTLWPLSLLRILSVGCRS